MIPAEINGCSVVMYFCCEKTLGKEFHKRKILHINENFSFYIAEPDLNFFNKIILLFSLHFNTFFFLLF